MIGSGDKRLKVYQVHEMGLRGGRNDFAEILHFGTPKNKNNGKSFSRGQNLRLLGWSRNQNKNDKEKTEGKKKLQNTLQ